METVENLITDEQIDFSWGNADFGKVEKRDIVKFSLLKWACDFESGHTAQFILQNLGLLTLDNKLTKLGKRYLFAAFKHNTTKIYENNI